MAKNNAEVIWQSIVAILEIFPQDIQTIKLDQSQGLWFHAKSSNNAISIDAAKIKQPSSSLSSVRYIDREEFLELYPLYFQWQEGSITRMEIRELSQNSSYIFAIIHRFVSLG